MKACVEKANCAGFSYNPPPSRYASNCYLFSEIGKNWNEYATGWNSGFRCDIRPPVMPTGRPSIESWTSWTSVATTEAPAPTPPPAPAVPTCQNQATSLCKVYGDPHFMTLDGRFINNQGKGFKLISQFNRANLPNYRVVAYTKAMWWFNPYVSMVEQTQVSFQSQTPGRGRQNLNTIINCQ